jgi:hypothetical protein
MRVLTFDVPPQEVKNFFYTLFLDEVLCSFRECISCNISRERIFCKCTLYRFEIMCQNVLRTLNTFMLLS